MNKDPKRQFDVLVVGGGPAGIAAAVRGAERGAHVGIVDDNTTLGGQIWRGEIQGEDSHDKQVPEAARWRELLTASPVTQLCGLRIFHQPEPGILLAESADALCELHYQKLVIATGARERFLPFPGWTLPNVMGAGGLQAMVKCGLPIQGKRVVVAGTGPLLLAVASYLRQHGAEIPLICEQAPWSSLARFAASLFSHPEKIAQTLRLKKDLAGIPFAANSWPLAAHGRDAVESVTVSRSGKSQTVPCDYLAGGFHLVPNVELPLLLGCRLDNSCVHVDEFQQTSVQNVFCAGEPTGIGGLELSLIEGEIAGFAASGRTAEARKLFGKRRKARNFARILDRTFRLRPELASLPAADTIVCRCEDVPYVRLKGHGSWRSAKLHTRCGMGPCQGRICGPAVEFLFQWKPESVRPPIFPVRLENLAAVTVPAGARSDSVSGGHA